MNDVAEDIKDLLVEGGFGDFAYSKNDKYGIFTLEEPDSPNNTITVYGTPSQSTKVMTGNDMHHSGFQVRVRGTESSLKIRAKCEAIRLFLHKYTTKDGLPKKSVKFGNTRYDNILMDDESFFLKKDSKGRLIYTADGTAHRQDLPITEETE